MCDNIGDTPVVENSGLSADDATRKREERRREEWQMQKVRMLEDLWKLDQKNPIYKTLVHPAGEEPYKKEIRMRIEHEYTERQIQAHIQDFENLRNKKYLSKTNFGLNISDRNITFTKEMIKREIVEEQLRYKELNPALVKAQRQQLKAEDKRVMKLRYDFLRAQKKQQQEQQQAGNKKSKVVKNKSRRTKV